MTKILGFDISSSCIGWGLIEDEKLKDYGHISPLSNKYNIFERLDNTNEQVLYLLKRTSPDIIGMEDILLFVPKKSSANTIITLGVFNRTVGLTAYNYLEKPPVLLPSQTIRKIIRHKHQIEVLKKENIPEVINQYLGNFTLEFKKTGKLKNYIYDQADGIAVAWAIQIMESEK